jgi:Mor family transcriptional regulator
MSRRINGRQGDVIEALMRLGVPVLVRAGGLPEATACIAMREAIHAFCIEWGGDHFYMPRDVDYPLLARDSEVFDLFDGTNTAELGRAFRLSIRQIRCILNAEGQRRRKARPAPQDQEVPP